jgi:DNA-binding response OmpR family regulator
MDKSKRRILIVDDDPDTIAILKHMLDHEQYECVSVERGAAALETLRATPVDVILLDVMMPEMTGLQVCEQLRADDTLREIPVILVTCRDDMETRHRGMSLGVTEYLTKPIVKRELLARIAAQLHGVELGRRLTKTEAAL